MHTFMYKDPDGVGVVINHNGDYSGDAQVRVSTPGGDAVSIEIPCNALISFCGEAVRGKLISALEDTELLMGNREG